MNSNERTFTFNPYWLWSLPESERSEVHLWMKEAGMDIQLATGMDYSPEEKLITTVYFELDDNGNYVADAEGNPCLEHQAREFHADNPPQSVLDELRRVRHA